MTPPTLPWWEEGEARIGSVVAGLDDAALDAPSLLPGWTRRLVVAHLGRNADALANLLHWGRTGEETPMYASPEARERDIIATAASAGDVLRADVADAVGRLSGAMRDHPDTAWGTPVRTAQGRTVPVSEVPWMRCREVWVHAVDLDAGVAFADFPDDVLQAFADDVLAAWDRRGESTAADLDAYDLPRRVALLTGRDQVEGLTLPRWL